MSFSSSPICAADEGHLAAVRAPSEFRTLCGHVIDMSKKFRERLPGVVDTTSKIASMTTPFVSPRYKHGTARSRSAKQPTLFERSCSLTCTDLWGLSREGPTLQISGCSNGFFIGPGTSLHHDSSVVFGKLRLLEPSPCLISTVTPFGSGHYPSIAKHI